MPLSDEELGRAHREVKECTAREHEIKLELGKLGSDLKTIGGLLMSDPTRLKITGMPISDEQLADSNAPLFDSTRIVETLDRVKVLVPELSKCINARKSAETKIKQV